MSSVPAGTNTELHYIADGTLREKLLRTLPGAKLSEGDERVVAVHALSKAFDRRGENLVTIERRAYRVQMLEKQLDEARTKLDEARTKLERAHQGRTQHIANCELAVERLGQLIGPYAAEAVVALLGTTPLHQQTSATELIELAEATVS